MNNEIEKIKWTIKDVIIALTLIFVATFIILFTITIVVFSLKEEIAMSKEVPLIKEIVILFSKLVIASSISLIVWFFSLKKYHCKWNALGFVFKNAKRDILIGALSGVLIFIIVNLVRIPFLHTKAIIAVGEGFKNFIPSLMHTEIKFVTFGILISFLSAASEEMAFSGFAYPAFRKKYGILLGLLITASVFWFMHFQLGFPKFFIVNFATHFIPGICYAYLYEKRRSLITPITAHFISNILAKII